MDPIYILVVVFLLVKSTHQQGIGQERKQEFCKAVQTNDVLEEALPLIRRHLETETQLCRQQIDEINVKLRTLQAELETTKAQLQELKEGQQFHYTRRHNTKIPQSPKTRPYMTIAVNTTPAPTTTTTNAPQECVSGWISSPEKCYYVSSNSERTEWAEAKDRCNSLGARLAEIKTDDEARFILNYLPNYIERFDLIFTGRRRNTNNKWVFISNNEEVDTSVRTWADKQPQGGSERCGCTLKVDHFNMHDCYCTGVNYFYICEIMR